MVQATGIEPAIPQGEPDLQSGAIPLRRRLHKLAEGGRIERLCLISYTLVFRTSRPPLSATLRKLAEGAWIEHALDD